MAAKVNKYRKVQKRLGDSVEVEDAFDPEKYAARLEAFEAAELPEDDGWGRGKHGRLPPADADASRLVAAKTPTRPSRRNRATTTTSSASTWSRTRTRKMPAAIGAKPGAKREPRNTKPGAANGKGWNKTVKDRLRWEKEKAAKAEEMRDLRAKWAEEDAARRAFYEKRNERRGKFRKKNARGQPVMKHRVDKILEQLQAGGA